MGLVICGVQPAPLTIAVPSIGQDTKKEIIALKAVELAFNELFTLYTKTRIKRHNSAITVYLPGRWLVELLNVKRKLRGDAEIAKQEHSLSCKTKTVYREYHGIPVTFVRATANRPWYIEATKLAKSALCGERTNPILSPSLTWNEAGIHEIANHTNFTEQTDNRIATLLSR